MLAILLLFASILRAQDDPASALERELKKVVGVFATVDREAADPVAGDRIFYQGAIPGMLRALDPHSIFFDPGQFEQLQQMQKGESKGFGTIVSVLPGRVIVLQTMAGAPGAKAGLAPGDEILAINGYVLAQLEFEQLVQLLTEARQRKALLDVRRPGNVRLFRLTLTPELVDSPSVDRGFLLAPGIGYLRITGFEEPTGKLVKQTIEKLGGEDLKGLVVDLRDNPGGAVQAAVETASLFLQPEQLVFTIKGRSKTDEEVRVPKFDKPYVFPVAVLINGKSASASEILTGALQDHDRAVVLGEPSFGKGLVQNVFPLTGGTGIALTTAYYYTPSGRSIQRPLASGQLDAADIVPHGTFRTDKGREVPGGGGLQPDEIVLQEPLSRLAIVLDASGSITSFAGEYVQAHQIDENLEVTPAMLDELQMFLSSRNIRPAVGEWLRHREWLQSRLRQEILTLKFGVAKGDEVEMQRDTVVRQAVKRLGDAQR
jgi:carboxyl-terminal processing protease